MRKYHLTARTMVLVEEVEEAATAVKEVEAAVHQIGGDAAARKTMVGSMAGVVVDDGGQRAQMCWL